MILSIAGTPTRHYYQHEGDRAYAPAKESARQLLESVGTLRSTATAEPANLSCVLGQSALALMTLPPLAAIGTLSVDGEVEHVGQVVAIEWTPAGLVVDLQA